MVESNPEEGPTKVGEVAAMLPPGLARVGGGEPGRVANPSFPEILRRLFA